MRVIAGAQKGRRLSGPSGPGLRPTSNRVKEALFSILGGRIVEARFADLYAGTGAIGIEALSRGAQYVAFVESNSKATRLLKANLEQCGFSALADVYTLPVAGFFDRKPSHRVNFDIIFADPPYGSDPGTDLLPFLSGSVSITRNSLVILEHSNKTHIPVTWGRLSQVRRYRYGDTILSVFAMSTEGASAL